MDGCPPVRIRDLGLTDYEATLGLQRDLRAARIAGETGDLLLLTEHHPVFTLGRGHQKPDLRAGHDAIDRLGIPIVQTERGGDITWHGPGQLVAYPIVDLRARGLGVVDYVGALEAAVIAALGDFGISGDQVAGRRGVWAGGRKIASIGVHVRRWVTMHGLALNVCPDLSHFALINPCGMADVEMTSMAREAGCEVAVKEARRALVGAFEAVLGWEMAIGPIPGAV